MSAEPIAVVAERAVTDADLAALLVGVQPGVPQAALTPRRLRGAKRAVGLPLDPVTLLVDRPVAATEQAKVRQRRRAPRRPVAEVMPLGDAAYRGGRLQ
jgi:hypothetical protein